MPLPPFLPCDIAEFLGRGGTVVTGNQRAARTLQLGFDRECRARGLASWQPPAIFAWDTWAASLYRQLLHDGRVTALLLNHSQELQVWRSVVESDGQQADSSWTSLQTADALATMALDAWHLLCAYRGQPRIRDLGVSLDTNTFQRWAQSFGRRCKTDNYLSAGELEQALLAAGDFLVSQDFASTGIRAVGFDFQTPAQKALFDALRERGILVEDQAHAPVASQLHLVAAETPDDELAQAAVWTRDFLIARPEATVAVIVPGLAAERREIDRVFRHLLAPELEDIAGATGSPYEFSLGQTLAGVPLVATAIEILRLSGDARPIANISRILLSPYFAAGPDELACRAEFDAFELRKAGSLRPEMTLGRLIVLVSTSRREGDRPVHLLSQLRSLERTAAKLLAPRSGSSSWSDWAEAMRELLAASGWPGAKPLDSTEFQARQKFESALDELATLDFEGTRCNFSTALGQLEAILRRTLFAPESREVPVQIMSPLEAAGSSFDAVWFLRASDLEWPVRPALNALLGWRLQHQLAMPGSDAELDRELAQRITGRIAASADTVVFSYARQTEERHQRASPMLAALGLETGVSPGMPVVPEAVVLETVADDAFVPLTSFDVAGGAGVLKDQAACGFLAFARRRLAATPIDILEPGMDALERGSIVHVALDHLWSEVRSQAELRAMTPVERAAQLSRSIEHSLRRADARLDADPTASAWDSAYLDLQRERLHRLLTPWLDIELARPAFEVAQREEREAVTIGPLSLKIRIDRVDRLLDEPGGSVLIDYKTGPAKPSAWAGDRPDEPQLPLYAVLREPDSLAAVVFANIRAGKEMALQGHASREGILAKPARLKFASLEEQVEDWQRVLIGLANDFALGDARVRPKTFPGTCKHCHQRILCRVDPAALANEDEEDEDRDDSFGESDE